MVRLCIAVEPQALSATLVLPLVSDPGDSWQDQRAVTTPGRPLQKVTSTGTEGTRGAATPEVAQC